MGDSRVERILRGEYTGPPQSRVEKALLDFIVGDSDDVTSEQVSEIVAAQIEPLIDAINSKQDKIPDLDHYVVANVK